MSHGLPFFGPGTWLIFGVVLLPIYVMISAWLTGKPRDAKTIALGLGYLVGITTAMWGGFFLLTMVIRLIFF